MIHSSLLREVLQCCGTTIALRKFNPQIMEFQMNKYTLLITLMCLTIIGCGGADIRPLTVEMTALRTQLSELRETNARLAQDRADLMVGRPIASETSGGEAAPVAAPAPVRVAAPTAPAVRAPRMAYTPSAPARGNALQMCDGVDGQGMLAANVLTSSMAFAPGSESAGTMNYLVLKITNSSAFDIAFSLNGRRVHIFAGGRAIMMGDTSGTCAMPIIPSRTGPTSSGFTRMNVSMVDYPAQTENTITYSCYRSAGGRIATRPTAQGSKTLHMNGNEAAWLITGAECGDHRLGA